LICSLPTEKPSLSGRNEAPAMLVVAFRLRQHASRLHHV
jgi:hypothetical protein